MSWLDHFVEGVLRRLMGDYPDAEQPKRLRRTERLTHVIETQIRSGDRLRVDYRRMDERLRR